MKIAVLAALVLIADFCSAQAGDEYTYSIILPKFVRPGVPTKFVAEIFLDEPVEIRATLSSNDFLSNIKRVVKYGESAIMEFDPVPLDYEGSTDFKVRVEGDNFVTGEEVFSTSTEEMEFQKKFISIFIQSDKAIYQPSQTIKFRAVVTDSDLLPYDGTASYRLVDPNSNIIIQKKHAQLERGVVGAEFTLGKYSTQGDWKIVYEVHGYEETLTVTVEEYKLPKFQVEIKLDKTYLHPGSSALTGEITATYTFGQPVKGPARLEIETTRYLRRGEKRPKIIKKLSDFDGSEDFRISTLELKNFLQVDLQSSYIGYNLKLTAFVKDKNSEDEFKDTVTVELKTTKYKIEAVAKPANIKPGLPYRAYLKVSEHDGTLLSSSVRRDLNLQVKIEYRYPYIGWWSPRPPGKVVTKDLDVGSDGIAILDMVAEPDKFENIYFSTTISKAYDPHDRSRISWSARRFESPSDTFIQISTEDTSLSVNDKARLTIQTTKKADAYWLMMLAKGKLIKKDMPEPAAYKKKEHSYEFYYDFTVTSEMSPNMYVIISYIQPDGELIADSIKIDVQAALKNRVTMTTSTDETDAGKPVKITVQAADNSFVGLRAIDQSVLLLKEGNDITQDKIFADLDKYGASSNRFIGWGGGFRRWWWPYPIGGADVKEIFDNSGVIVLTDATVYSRRPTSPYYLGCGGVRGKRCVMPRTLGGSFARQRSPYVNLEQNISPAKAPATSETKTRSHFPETWIWESSNAGPDGSVTFSYNTPDTITTWELSSFAVSERKGLGVTKQNSKITVFRNFFISLNLPPTMTRGEILNMRTTLFNYYDRELDVTVTLKDNDWYDLVIVGYDPVAAGPRRKITIPSKDSVTVVFPIKFMKAGLARISVSANAGVAGDAVERTLVVKPEGIPKTVSHSTIIDRSSKYDPDTVVTFDVDIPKDAVEGSPYVKFSVSGNILGSALNNLGNLLKMPGGCGEQTMLSFAPDVYISLYLKEVGQLRGAIKQKSTSHIQQGYQNELRYQHKDGSFSAFGESDRSGSTWLTAFVAKCFIAATELDSDLVERSKIDRAVDFIIKQQSPDGTFREPGHVIHQAMQGGVDSKETTTAYMLIAMAEGGFFEDDSAALQAMDKAQRYLERRIDYIRDTYTLAIVGYALSLVDSKEADNVMSLLDDRATVSGNLRYWEKEEKGMSHCEERKEYCPLTDKKAGSSSVEITAYVLLMYVKMGKGKSAMPIVRWLVEQRGSFGGYHSTQDTVMAIQALSTVARLFSSRDTKMDIVATGDGFEESFKLNAGNAIQLQMADLPPVPGTVTVTASGEGVADVQLTVTYNLPVGPRSDEPFTLDVDVKKNGKDGNVVDLVVCSKINENRKEVVDKTGMYVVTVTLPSGYTIDDKQATRDNKQLKLVELDGDEVTGYFDELPKGRTMCMDLKLMRYAEVSGVKPQLIKAFDYYVPGRVAMRTYRPGKEEDAEEAEICSLCGNDCVGCSGLKEPRTRKPAKSYCDKCFNSCPDFVDGLFYDDESGIMDLLGKFPSQTACTAPNGAGDSSPYVGLPGTLFDEPSHHITCTNTIFGKALMSDQGFTVSLLIYPLRVAKNKQHTVFSIGSGSGPAGELYLLFEKKKGSDFYWLKYRTGSNLYTIRPIPITHIPVNAWTVITFVNSKTYGPRLYVDCAETGTRLRRQTSKVNPIPQDVTMMIGRSHVSKSDDAFSGLVSHLDVWEKALPERDIQAICPCLQPLMTKKNPMLNKAQVHHLVPDSIRHCFSGNYNADALRGDDVTRRC